MTYQNVTMQLFKSPSCRPFLSYNFSFGRLAPSLRLLSRGVGEASTGPEAATEVVDYEGTLAILNRYQRYPSAPPDEPARERTKSWLSLLGFDVNRLRIPKVIHVAGTKGKGTTCYYISRMLLEHQRITGYPQKIGCLTSPHKIDVRERILINNEKISKPLFSHHVRMLDTKIQWLSSQPDLKTPLVPRFPAFMSLLGISFFLEEKNDVVIIETGMGGEMDSTNVFPCPVATGITSIGIDHVQVLGDTVDKIAWHKAGIFKPDSVAGTVVQDPAVLNVLRGRAEEKRVAGELQVITDRRVFELGVKVDPDMPYQRSNLALAMFLTEKLLKSENPKFSVTADIARSVQDVVLLGRSQVVEDGDYTWFISSAVNDISLREALSWFKSVQHSKRHITVPRVLLFNQNFSKVSPRDPIPMLQIIHEALCADTPMVFEGVVFCTDQLDEIGNEKSDSIDFRVDRKALSSLEDQRANSKTWKELGGSGDTMVVHTTKAAVRLIQEKYKGAEVLVAGSGFLAGNVLQILRSSGLRI